MTANTPTPEITAPAVPACSPYSSAAGLAGKFAYNAATGDLTVSGGKTASLANGTYCFHNLIALRRIGADRRAAPSRSSRRAS